MWTIIATFIFVFGVLLFVFSGFMPLFGDSKKISVGKIIAQQFMAAVAVIMMVGGACRLFVPYYLVKVNPAIVQDMVTGMQEQQEREKEIAIRKVMEEEGDNMMRRAPVLGNREDAKKTIYVWTDFSCPYCRRVHGELARVMADRDDVRVVVKNFSIHGPLSDAPARAVIAAKLQDPAKAAELTDMLMTREFYTQDDLKDQSKIAEKVEANVMKMAKEVGLDTEKLKEDMKGSEVAEEMREVRDLAQRFEISGTPFLLVEGQAFPGAVPAATIEEALDK
ncbi:MAG: DsbA family protein [Proteobacteria bacterium]|uniref:DsbA family protein n=1 Tax=Candidatus Enterousia excrementavium TaxID=2840789 RepID=A0A940DFB2_9PROT|nr:DsbA family protein [Candidatus Enterousia excrementavium]